MRGRDKSQKIRQEGLVGSLTLGHRTLLEVMPSLWRLPLLQIDRAIGFNRA